ncbi:MAG: NUDIX domain-containing protein [Sediminibacterium sp.]
MRLITQYNKHDKFLLAVDCIIFGFDGTKLKVLLIQRDFEPGKGKWSLMGGFVNRNESVTDAAARVLFELTKLSDIYMEQLHCFGEVARDPGGPVISIAHFALISIEKYDQQMDVTHHAKWFDLDKLPSLLFDHKKMIGQAKERLQNRVANHPIGFALLPEKFTLPQLQLLYEAIYGVEIDKRNFARKILSLHILKKLKIKEKNTSRKGAFLYVFDSKKYQKLDKEGFRLI